MTASLSSRERFCRDRDHAGFAATRGDDRGQDAGRTSTSSDAPFGGVRIADMPDLGVFTDASSVVGEKAGSGRFAAAALLSYFSSGLGRAGNVKDYGAIMDGASHPLSSVYPSLSAAQAVYPHATSLTDEIDWCAIQACVNALNTAILIPQGTAIINRPVVSSTVPITVQGTGQNSTIIKQTTAGADGWQHTSSQTFQMFDLDFRCVGACGTALNLNFAGSATLFTLRGVTIAGTTAPTDYWHDGVKAVGCNRTSIERVLVAGIGGSPPGPLANIGNGIYLAPTTTPAPAGSFVIEISNTIVNYYQYALVLDSFDETVGRPFPGNTNIQGVVLDWFNSNQCMQAVRVLGSVLELVMSKCQTQTYGSAIYAELASTVRVRDCLFFFNAPDAYSVPGPAQDAINIKGGGDWWIESNRFVMLPDAQLGWFYNIGPGLTAGGITQPAGGFVLEGNSHWIANTAGHLPIANGLIHLAYGTHHVQERGSLFSQWPPAGQTWPYVVNDNTDTTGGNAFGGVANSLSLGAIAPDALARFGPDQWQQQGGYLTWNYPYQAGSGITSLFNSHGGAAGGFNFYNVASIPDPAQVPTLLASILPTLATFYQAQLQIGGASGPSWRTGTGSPSGVLPGSRAACSLDLMALSARRSMYARAAPSGMLWRECEMPSH